MTEIIEQPKFPATVVKIINSYRVVINRGGQHSIKVGQRFLIYELGTEEIKDVVSGEFLGYLELPKGTGKVISIQEKMSIIESDRWEPSEKIVRKQHMLGMYSPQEEIITPSNRLEPFDDPKIGDKAKPI